MELTLRKKTLWIAIVALASLALVTAGALLTMHAIPPALEPDSAAVTAQAPTHTAATRSLPEDRFRFLNQSTAWYWNPSGQCLQQLEGYLADFEIRSAEIILTDDAQHLLVGVHYPDTQEEQASARVGCRQRDLTKADRSNLICQVAITKGEPGPALDVAATVAVAWGIQDYFRPRNQGAWETQQHRAWNWDSFQPLITKESETWHANCLSIAKR